jgi:hypothetical protein
MKLERYFTIFLVVFIAIALLYLFARGSTGGSGIIGVAQAGGMPTGGILLEPKSTGSMGPGDAVIELAPELGNNSIVLKFRINTHSVRLSGFNLKEITTLEYGGAVFKPVSASRIGGHHASGTIKFRLDAEADGFTVKIRSIPAIEERVYTWNTG